MNAEDLTGQVWFDYVSPHVWRFYRFVRSVAETGTPVSLDWQPLPTEGQELAMTALATLTDPADRGRFLHAMLGLVHIKELAVEDPEIVARAAAVAGVHVPETPDAVMLADLTAQAASIGVDGTPSLYRHGSPMRIVLTEAALIDEPVATFATIISTADNDGIWELRKP